MKRLILPITLAFTLASCGQNLLKTGESTDPAEDATIALDRGDADKAINILEAALEDDAGNPQYLSILALAYAYRAGIAPLEFATRLSETNGTSTALATSSSSFSAMFSVLPAATEQVLSDIDRAVEILTSDMSADERQPGDIFKIAIFQSAAMLLHSKALDKNGDGTLSIDEIVNLSNTSATGILSQLSSARSVLEASAGNDAASKAAFDALDKYSGAISAEEGSTDEEKLRNFLARNPSAAAEAQGG
jgi:DNA polymerase III delta prime subunit